MDDEMQAMTSNADLSVLQGDWNLIQYLDGCDDVKLDLTLDGACLNSNSLQIKENSDCKDFASESMQSDIPSSSRQMALPLRDNWPGEYEFDVKFRDQEQTGKSIPWTYSERKDKLYVNKDVLCPISFSVNERLRGEFVVRVLAMFSAWDHAHEVVRRCINHSREDQMRGIYESDHLIRCESNGATYITDSYTGRHCVIVPFENPVAGGDFTTYLFKFKCFGSCAGTEGPNRKPMILVFTLEYKNRVVGRRKLDLKICACPGRDRNTEENQQKKRQKDEAERQMDEAVDPAIFMRSSPNMFPMKCNLLVDSSGKFNLLMDSSGCYWIGTRSKACVELLHQVKNAFQTATSSKRLNRRCMENGSSSESTST